MDKCLPSWLYIFYLKPIQLFVCVLFVNFKVESLPLSESANTEHLAWNMRRNSFESGA